MPTLEVHNCEECGKDTFQDNVIEIKLRNPRHLLWGGKKSYWLCSEKCARKFLKNTENTPYGIMTKEKIVRMRV